MEKCSTVIETILGNSLTIKLIWHLNFPVKTRTVTEWNFLLKNILTEIPYSKNWRLKRKAFIPFFLYILYYRVTLLASSSRGEVLITQQFQLLNMEGTTDLVNHHFATLNEITDSGNNNSLLDKTTGYKIYKELDNEGSRLSLWSYYQS